MNTTVSRVYFEQQRESVGKRKRKIYYVRVDMVSGCLTETSVHSTRISIDPSLLYLPTEYL